MDKRTQIAGTGTSLATTRRGFVALSAAAAFPAGAAAAADVKIEVAERAVTVAGPAGPLGARMFRATTGDHPGLVLWATPSGATRAVAKGLAEQGWAVLLVPETASEPGALHREARAVVDWLSRQDGVRAAGPAERTGQGLGHGYVLRTVCAAQPRLSLATRDERVRAASSAWLFAAPEAELRGRSPRLAQLEGAVRGAFRAGALAA